MLDIGFQHNGPKGGDWDLGLTPSVRNRIDLIDERLRAQDLRLFVYSPAAIDPRRETVAGFRREGGVFVPAVAAIPRVNGNWTTMTKRLLGRGMGYAAFVQWASATGIEIYVPHAFSDLLTDKLETYKLVHGFHADLHPHCEPYEHARRQIEHFVEAAPITFVKPRTGSRGEGIVTLRRDANGLKVTRYRKGRRRVWRAAQVAEVMGVLEEVTAGRREYIVQQGIDTLRLGTSTFDIRVTMSYDGAQWHWLTEARLSPTGSDVSNVGQGGASQVTEDLLFEVLGPESSRDVLYELRNESFGLAAYLDQLHPGQILEIAFDFVLDRKCRPRLLEINTKPGLPGPGSNIYLRDLRPENSHTFENWVYPHVGRLARFLAGKVGVALFD